MYCVGNGQMHQVHLQEKTGALNCMHDQQIILGGAGHGDCCKKINAA